MSENCHPPLLLPHLLPSPLHGSISSYGCVVQIPPRGKVASRSSWKKQEVKGKRIPLGVGSRTPLGRGLMLRPERKGLGGTKDQLQETAPHPLHSPRGVSRAWGTGPKALLSGAQSREHCLETWLKPPFSMSTSPFQAVHPVGMGRQGWAEMPRADRAEGPSPGNTEQAVDTGLRDTLEPLHEAR